MISPQMPVRQKLPGETKIYQVDLSIFLVAGEGLEGDDFSVECYEYSTVVLHEQDLKGVVRFSLQTQLSNGTLDATTWDVEQGMQRLVLLAGRTQGTPANLIVPGTKVWDAANKIASVAVQGGENGKDYLLLWKFKTTSRREEWEAMLIQVRQDFVI